MQILALQALNNHGPAVTLNGLTLRNGKSSGAGGAIFNDQGTLTITNASFLDNSAATSGGAIENAGGVVAGDEQHLRRQPRGRHRRRDGRGDRQQRLWQSDRHSEHDQR